MYGAVDAQVAPSHPLSPSYYSQGEGQPGYPGPGQPEKPGQPASTPPDQAGYQPGFPPPGQPGFPPPGQPGFPPPGQPGVPPPGQPGVPPPGQPGFPPQRQPGFPPQGQPGFPPQRQPGFPPQGQPGFPPQGQPGFPPQGHPGFPPQGHPGFPPQGHPGFPPQGHPGFPPQRQPGFPPQGQPGFPPPGQPGYGHQNYPQAGYPAGPPPASMGHPSFGAGGPQPGPGGPPSVPGAGLKPWQPGSDGPYLWENLPEKPPNDDPNRAAPPPPPPPMMDMRPFPGYEGIGGYGQNVPMMPPPPPSAPPMDTQQPPTMEFDDVANLDETQCRDAMLAFVGEHCCYGKGCAKNHEIRRIEPSTALHYTLETYCESRITGYKYKAHNGGPVDGPDGGTPPMPWAIECTADELFMNQTKQIMVPHTSTIKDCHRCEAKGFIRCYRCHGMGRVRCSPCGGDGRTRRLDSQTNTWVEGRCNTCQGDGWRRCLLCHGDGRVRCSECQGYRQLLWYIELTVTFSNHQADHIIEKTDMPDQLVRDVQGTTIFEQVLPQVWPIIAYPVQEINDNSQRLVGQHKTAFPSERQLQQRQVLRAVPVTEVHYKWKDVKSRYWVYGRERRCYSPDYPQTCCWGCQLL